MNDLVAIAVQVLPKGRVERFMGREHRVFPAVLVKSQVLTNNLGVTYLPPDAITPAWASIANMAPVLVDHPVRRGQPISARDPEILNARGTGFLLRARVENGELRADVFLDPNRAADVPELATILARLDKGEKTELSTGFPVAVEETPGAFNGVAYERVIRPIGFDHLAIFADKIGACSVTDGCGLAANHDGPCQTGDEPVDEKVVGRFTQAIDKLVMFLGGQKEAEPKPAANKGEDPPRKGDDAMNRDTLIAQLAAAGPLDKDALNKLSDCQLTALAGADAKNTQPEPTGDVAEALRLAHKYRAENETLRAQYEPARKAQERRRIEMMDDLIYNARDLPHTEAEIRAMDFVEMEKVYRLAFPRRVDYSGRGGPRTGDSAVAVDWVQPILSAHNSALDKADRKEAH